MPLSLDDVSGAIVPGIPETAAAPAAAVPGGEATIPDSVLEIPEFSGLLEGKPAAVWTEQGDKNPVIAPILESADALINAGFGFYHSKDESTDVLFNTQFVSEDEIKKADDGGKLREIAAPLGELLSSYEALLAPGGPESASGAPPPSAAPTAPGASVPASVEKKLTTARLKNVAVGGPTSGPLPGAGRLLNQLATPVV